MSATPAPRPHWTGPSSAGVRAEEQVAQTVRLLCRARARQSMVEHAAAGLLAALLAASAAVLAIRLGVVALPAGLTVVALLLTALTVSAGIGWLRRPDDLAVAIDADVRLNLKQRLSTAWEVARAGGDEELARRLAAQAVHARLPGRSVSVFPARLSAAGLLVPVAAIALALVSIVDVEQVQRDEPPGVDRSVASEGLRLRDYGQRMEARARRDALPRSGEAAKRLQQLGSRMHAGALDRDQALERLRRLDHTLDEQARDAMDRGPQTEVGPLAGQRLAGGPTGSGDARTMLRRLRDGALGEDEARRLAGEGEALAAAGVSREALDDALSRLRDGDPRALDDILERLAARERDAQDADELERARERLSRARESLGDPTAGDAPDSADVPAGGGREAAAAESGDGAGDEHDEAGDGGGAPGAPAGTAPPRPRAGDASRTPGDGPALAVDVSPREQGRVFVSRARALPRDSAIRTEPAEVDARFQPQLEAVMADERVPAAQKEFIKRYFLRLSDGADDEETSP